MQTVSIKIKRLSHAPEELPEYASLGAAGMDLRYAGEMITLGAGDRALLPTGFSISIPEGFEGQIRLRSGFAMRTGLILPNAPGTIDSDYRGEIKVLLMNCSTVPAAIEKHERFAQLIIAPIARGEWNEVDELDSSSRGQGGFGSTGKS